MRQAGLGKILCVTKIYICLIGSVGADLMSVKQARGEVLSVPECHLGVFVHAASARICHPRVSVCKFYTQRNFKAKLFASLCAIILC